MSKKLAKARTDENSKIESDRQATQLANLSDSKSGLSPNIHKELLGATSEIVLPNSNNHFLQDTDPYVQTSQQQLLVSLQQPKIKLQLKNAHLKNGKIIKDLQRRSGNNSKVTISHQQTKLRNQQSLSDQLLASTQLAFPHDFSKIVNSDEHRLLQIDGGMEGDEDDDINRFEEASKTEVRDVVHGGIKFSSSLNEITSEHKRQLLTDQDDVQYIKVLQTTTGDMQNYYRNRDLQQETRRNDEELTDNNSVETKTVTPIEPIFKNDTSGINRKSGDNILVRDSQNNAASSISYISITNLVEHGLINKSDYRKSRRSSNNQDEINNRSLKSSKDKGRSKNPNSYIDSQSNNQQFTHNVGIKMCNFDPSLIQNNSMMRNMGRRPKTSQSTHTNQFIGAKIRKTKNRLNVTADGFHQKNLNIKDAMTKGKQLMSAPLSVCLSIENSKNRQSNQQPVSQDHDKFDVDYLQVEQVVEQDQKTVVYEKTSSVSNSLESCQSLINLNSSNVGNYNKIFKKSHVYKKQQNIRIKQKLQYFRNLSQNQPNRCDNFKVTLASLRPGKKININKSGNDFGRSDKSNYGLTQTATNYQSSVHPYLRKEGSANVLKPRAQTALNNKRAIMNPQQSNSKIKRFTTANQNRIQVMVHDDSQNQAITLEDNLAAFQNHFNQSMTQSPKIVNEDSDIKKHNVDQQLNYGRMLFENNSGLESMASGIEVPSRGDDTANYSMFSSFKPMFKQIETNVSTAQINQTATQSQDKIKMSIILANQKNEKMSDNQSDTVVNNNPLNESKTQLKVGGQVIEPMIQMENCDRKVNDKESENKMKTFKYNIKEIKAKGKLNNDQKKTQNRVKSSSVVCRQVRYNHTKKFGIPPLMHGYLANHPKRVAQFTQQEINTKRRRAENRDDDYADTDSNQSEIKRGFNLISQRISEGGNIAGIVTSSGNEQQKAAIIILTTDTRKPSLPELESIKRKSDMSLTSTRQKEQEEEGRLSPLAQIQEVVENLNKDLTQVNSGSEAESHRLDQMNRQAKFINLNQSAKPESVYRSKSIDSQQERSSKFISQVAQSYEYKQSQLSAAKKSHIEFYQKRSVELSQAGINNGGKIEINGLLSVKQLLPNKNASILSKSGGLLNKSSSKMMNQKLDIDSAYQSSKGKKVKGPVNYKKEIYLSNPKPLSPHERMKKQQIDLKKTLSPVPSFQLYSSDQILVTQNMPEPTLHSRDENRNLPAKLDMDLYQKSYTLKNNEGMTIESQAGQTPQRHHFTSKESLNIFEQVVNSGTPGLKQLVPLVIDHQQVESQRRLKENVELVATPEMLAQGSGSASRDISTLHQRTSGANMDSSINSPYLLQQKLKSSNLRTINLTAQKDHNKEGSLNLGKGILNQNPDDEVILMDLKTENPSRQDIHVADINGIVISNQNKGLSQQVDYNVEEGQKMSALLMDWQKEATKSIKAMSKSQSNLENLILDHQNQSTLDENFISLRPSKKKERSSIVLKKEKDQDLVWEVRKSMHLTEYTEESHSNSKSRSGLKGGKKRSIDEIKKSIPKLKTSNSTKNRLLIQKEPQNSMSVLYDHIEQSQRLTDSRSENKDEGDKFETLKLDQNEQLQEKPGEGNNNQVLRDSRASFMHSSSNVNEDIEVQIGNNQRQSALHIDFRNSVNRFDQTNPNNSSPKMHWEERLERVYERIRQRKEFQARSDVEIRPDKKLKPLYVRMQSKKHPNQVELKPKVGPEIYRQQYKRLQVHQQKNLSQLRKVTDYHDHQPSQRSMRKHGLKVYANSIDIKQKSQKLQQQSNQDRKHAMGNSIGSISKKQPIVMSYQTMIRQENTEIQAIKSIAMDSLDVIRPNNTSASFVLDHQLKDRVKDSLDYFYIRMFHQNYKKNHRVMAYETQSSQNMIRPLRVKSRSALCRHPFFKNRNKANFIQEKESQVNAQKKVKLSEAFILNNKLDAEGSDADQNSDARQTQVLVSNTVVQQLQQSRIYSSQPSQQVYEDSQVQNSEQREDHRQKILMHDQSHIDPEQDSLLLESKQKALVKIPQPASCIISRQVSKFGAIFNDINTNNTNKNSTSDFYNQNQAETQNTFLLPKNTTTSFYNNKANGNFGGVNAPATNITERAHRAKVKKL